MLDGSSRSRGQGNGRCRLYLLKGLGVTLLLVFLTTLAGLLLTVSPRTKRVPFRRQKALPASPFRTAAKRQPADSKSAPPLLRPSVTSDTSAWSRLFRALHQFWQDVTAPSHDLLTAEQKGLLVRLRASLRRSNDENTSPGDRYGRRFVSGRHGIKRFHQRLPSSVEFQALVQASEPAIFTSPDVRCAEHNWTLAFVREMAGGDLVGVETSRSNRFYSNEGLKKEKMTVSQFLDVFQSPTRAKDYYLAEEDLGEMPLLKKDVTTPPFAAHLTLDKLQLWIGAGGQVSPLHQDQWENILCQMQGERTIVLFDPLDLDGLYPKDGVNRHFGMVDPEHVDASLFPRFRRGESISLSNWAEGRKGLTSAMVGNVSRKTVRSSEATPLSPSLKDDDDSDDDDSDGDGSSSQGSRSIEDDDQAPEDRGDESPKPYFVSLRSGEAMFLPAMWWHQVHHRSEVNVAVNFWFIPSLMSELLMDLLLPPGDM